MSGNFCCNCGSQLPPDAGFCAGCGQPVSAIPVPQDPAAQPAPTTRLNRWYPIVAVLVVLALAAGGAAWYFLRDKPGINSIAEYRRTFEERGWSTFDDDSDAFIAKSTYDLEDHGFAQVIEYRDEEAASTAQDERRELLAEMPGFEERTTDSARVFATSSAAVGAEADPVGSVEIVFGKYRFEASGNRMDIDDLVEKLGYLEDGYRPSGPIADFRAEVERADIAASHDGGYRERSAFEKSGLNTEYWTCHTLEDAKAGLDEVIERLEAGGQEYKFDDRGDVTTLWFVMDWTDPEGVTAPYYASRVYDGKAMMAISAPLEFRQEIEDLMEELGY